MKFFYCLFLQIILTVSFCFSQKPVDDVFRIDKIPTGGLLLNSGWKFHTGDNPQWAKMGVWDDGHWFSQDPTKDIKDIPELWKTNIGWFRLQFTLDSSIDQKSIVIRIEQTGASEIFLNGKLIDRFGSITDDPDSVKAASPVIGTFIAVPINKPGVQVIAVRFAVQKNLPYILFAGRPNVALALNVMEANSIGSYWRNEITVYFDFLRFGLFFILSILHLALFRFNPDQKGNLYFFLYALVNAIICILIGTVYRYVDFAAAKTFVLIVVAIGSLLGWLLFLTAVYKTFNRSKGLIYWMLSTATIFSVVLLFTNYKTGFNFGQIYVTVSIFIDATRITLLASRKKQKGANIVVAGIVSFLVFYFLFYAFAYGYLPPGPNWLYGHLAFNIGFLSIPVAISVFLALESSFASRSLKEKLEQVEQLSKINLAQELEKKQILATQNQKLEQLVHDRTIELNQSLKNLMNTQAQLIQSEKMASLGELTAGIAHEIQNPLNFVNNFSEVNEELIDELESEAEKGNFAEVKSIAQTIKDNEQKINVHGKRADAIVKGMLQHSRPTSGQRELTDINALAEEYLRISYQALKVKEKSFNAVIETKFDESLSADEAGLGRVNIIPQNIGRVLLNIYNNAFYALADKKKRNEAYQPKISVITKKMNSFTSGQEMLEIKIKDNGNGISQKNLDKIFQPFFTTKPTGHGTGLGLSLAYDIIKSHGGELKVNTVEGEFAEFIIVFPVGV